MKRKRKRQAESSETDRVYISPSLDGSTGKESGCNAGDTGDVGSTPSLGRSLEKGMATHSSILAWKILWTEKPGVLQSTGSLRVRQDCATEHTNQNSNMVS